MYRNNSIIRSIEINNIYENNFYSNNFSLSAYVNYKGHVSETQQNKSLRIDKALYFAAEHSSSIQKLF